MASESMLNIDGGDDNDDGDDDFHEYNYERGFQFEAIVIRWAFLNDHPVEAPYEYSVPLRGVRTVDSD